MKFGYDRSGTAMDSVSAFFPPGKLSRTRVPATRSAPPDAYLPQTAVNAGRVMPLPAFGMDAEGLESPMNASAGLAGLGEGEVTVSEWMEPSWTGGVYTPTSTPQMVYQTAMPGGESLNTLFGGASLKDWANTIAQLYVTGKTVEAQGKIIDLNMQRAQMGYAPLPASMFQPTVGMNFGLTPQGQETLMYAGIAALAAFVLLGRRSK